MCVAPAPGAKCAWELGILLMDTDSGSPHFHKRVPKILKMLQKISLMPLFIMYNNNYDVKI